MNKIAHRARLFGECAGLMVGCVAVVNCVAAATVRDWPIVVVLLFVAVAGLFARDWARDVRRESERLALVPLDGEAR
ncbi:hypothetical protein [Hyphococcus sp.]|uniref:hypothetical protein n=1 Tax=Hyphococcus sp. TaxID=2038636 RepID=UPI00208186BF|nr:MAG: hypothetical protein DHS20C04_32200 [Marinicaulis sp.]